MFNYTPLTISQTKAKLKCSEEEAVANLIRAATYIVKRYRYYPYKTKVSVLQKPLLQIKLARRK